MALPSIEALLLHQEKKECLAGCTKITCSVMIAEQVNTCESVFRDTNAALASKDNSIHILYKKRLCNTPVSLTSQIQNNFISSMLTYSILANNNHDLEARIKALESTMQEIFPELNMKQRLRIKNLKSAIASYDQRAMRIDIDPRPFSPDTNYLLTSVLAHETMHALQYVKRTIPYGERSCDLYMLARLPTEFYPRKREFYVKVPQRILSRAPDRIKETAERAIQLRNSGTRNYIVWFENELNARN